MSTCLVTGGGGFIGGAIVRQLIDRGLAVKSFSRKKYDELDELGVEQIAGDLGDKKAVVAACDGCDIVFHVAARPGAWGKWEDFYVPNVEGTRHVLEGCRQHGVGVLVFTSSPSVVFDGSDMEGADESAPYPETYEAHYPHTKAIAEKEVLAASCDELRTAAIRPHLVWGPRDNHLVPRIITRGKAGALRRIGRETKLIDTIYIDDAARAHLLAADRLASEQWQGVSGKAYFVSAGEPIDVWEMINRILDAGGVAPVTRTVSPKMARAAGFLMEKTWSALSLKGEPRMTRWVADNLSKAHWFDISAARRDLGYEPQISIDEGLAHLRDWLADNPL